MLMKHIWPLLTKKNTVWVKWVIVHRLKYKSFWDMEKSKQASWIWNYLLELRDQISNKVIMKIGNGETTSMWFDNWSLNGPLSNVITKRNIYEAGLVLEDTVADVISNGEWRWSEEWGNRYNKKPASAQI